MTLGSVPTLRASAVVLAMLAAGAAAAADTTANSGALRYSGEIEGGAGSLDFSLRISGGKITGTVSASPNSGFAITGEVLPRTSYWENGRCYVRVPGPPRTEYEFSGYCTTDRFHGRFATSGPGESMNGKFNAVGRNDDRSGGGAARAQVPTAKLTCYYMERDGNGFYEQRFSNMGSITLRADGSYVAGSGVTGRWTREAEEVRLVGGAWNNRIATLATDRTGSPKLVFRSVDPGITHCTAGR